jgi:hypothetical protein
MKKIILFTALSILTYVGLATTPETINLATVAPNTSGTGWDFGVTKTDVLTVFDGANITVTGTVTNSRRIEVAADAEATVTLNNLSITPVANAPYDLIALNNSVNGTTSLTLILAEGSVNNIGYSLGIGFTPIRVNAGTRLMIDGTGTLNVTEAGDKPIHHDFVGAISCGGHISVHPRGSGDIIINGGTVTTTNGGIGFWGSNAGAFTLNGNAVVFTPEIKTTQNLIKGILFIYGDIGHFVNEGGTVYGDVTLEQNLTIPEDVTLTVPSGASLTIPAGKTLTIPSNATLANNGIITVCGTIVGTVGGNLPQLHNFGELETVVAATCETDGYKARVCSLCGDETDVETIPKLEHDFSEIGTLENEATCTNPAIHKKKCSLCGIDHETETVEVGEPLGHTWVNATCTTPKTCSVCQATEGTALGHTWVAATCTMPKTCSVCQETEGAALGHTWVNATCTAPKICSVCQETEGAALGHTWVAATCTTPKTCSVCQETEGNPLGHTWVNATCTAPKTCSVCQETEGNPLGHTWVNATCTAPKICSVCQETEGAALGHTWVVADCTTPETCSVCQETEGEPLGHDMPANWTVRTAPTCDIEGLEFKKCSRCTHEITQAIPKLTGADCEPSSIQDLENENTLNIFPNPVSYELRITNLEWKQGEMAELFDMKGRRVYSAPANNSEITINMSSFQNGNYILRIGNRVARIVKQ